MKAYSANEAAHHFPPRLRRGQVLEMGRKLGLSEWTVRGMLEGTSAVIKGIIYPGTRKAYFDREEVIRALFNSPPAQPAKAS